MAALFHPSTSPIFTPVFSSSQNLALFNSPRKEKRTPLDRGNSAPLSLVPFGSTLPLKSRRTSKLRTFIWYCKPHGGSEVQLLDLVEKEHVIREKMEGSIAEDYKYQTPKTSEKSDFVERDGELGTIGTGGSTKIAMDSSTNSNTENLNSDSGRGPGSLSVVDYVKRIASLPIEERVRVLDLLQCDNQSLTISDYNDILEALLRAEEFEHVIKLFSELEPNGIKPNIRSFSILVNCFCKKNNPFEAKRVLDEMWQNGFIPNVVTFTSVVRSLCKRGRVTIAMDVLDKMRKASVDPTIQTYNNLIVGLCYVGRLEEVSELVDNLKNSPTKPDIYTYTLVIDSFCKVGKVDEAIELFNEAKEKGLKPSIYTYNALLNGFCKKSRTAEAVSLLKEMEAQGIKPDGICYNIVLRGHLVNREYSLAWEMFKRTREAGFPLGMRSTNAVLRGLCRLSLTNKEILKDVKELFEIIVELQFGPTPYTYCLMIQALASAGEIDSALVHLNNMVNTGACPRMLTCNMVIRLLCREGKVYDAQSVLVTMIKLGKLPGTFSFEIILNESSSQGKFSDALALYGVALKLGIDPKWRFKYQLSCRNDSK
ncbi:pentatricopeptide repeat-containing protein [Carex littledalei]|uniref:Pentatricopeptide repeat-containing protein n=1 Tax=Carex littledalei TaxID=544730 RepID=A0A833VRC7_9POAL|nr:pentatricopeptide repeat-containing protein [Carex littledalei]